MNPIPYGKQFISDDDVSAVVTALKSDFLTQGPTILEFEQKFASYVNAKYAVAVSNGTAALHLCAMALDVKPGDNVITTPITFVASANCIKYCGGEVTFADIDAETFLIDIESVKKILQNSPKGTYKGIVPVDFAGRSVNMEAFRCLADEYGLWIIEDACHAPGGFFLDSKKGNQSCGNGNFAELSIFSFHPVKHIATGEGGMITTNNKNLYEALLKFRTHGITRDIANFQNSMELAVGDNPNNVLEYPLWYMEMQVLGYNYRITDIQAALGISQLKRAEAGIERRRAIAKRYYEAFQSLSSIYNQSGVVEGHAYHLYVIQCNKRLELYNYLRQKQIFAQVHYFPSHLMPYYQSLGYKKGDFPNAEAYYSNCLSLPMYPTLTEEEQEYVISEIFNFFGK
jgi:UDP-4-amino-4,6-dideoxy-N-acetyl-beta-L-altrosamine transaminase